MNGSSIIWRHAVGVLFAVQMIYITAGVAAAWRLNAYQSVTVSPNSDHWPLTKRILRTEPITNFRYPPGFALYMASAVRLDQQSGVGYFWIRLLQDSISTGITGLLILLLIVRLTGSVWLGWCGALCLVFNLSFSAGTALDLAMASFMPWFFGGVLLLVRSMLDASWRRTQSIVAGVLIAVSGFIRPDVLLFVPFVLFMAVAWNHLRSSDLLWPRSRRVNYVPIAFALLGFCFAFLPWTVYASKQSGNLVFYSTGLLPSHIDGMKRFGSNAASQAFQIDTQRPESIRGLVETHISLMRGYPMDWIALWARKPWRPWFASDSGRWDWIFALQTLLIAPFVLSGILLWIVRRKAELPFFLGVTVILYFWLISMAVLSINRYMVPVYPFLGMFIGYSLQSIFHAARNRSTCPSSVS